MLLQKMSQYRLRLVSNVCSVAQCRCECGNPVEQDGMICAECFMDYMSDEDLPCVLKPVLSVSLAQVEAAIRAGLERLEQRVG
jgi:hypothetical protein